MATPNQRDNIISLPLLSRHMNANSRRTALHFIKIHLGDDIGGLNNDVLGGAIRKFANNKYDGMNRSL